MDRWMETMALKSGTFIDLLVKLSRVEVETVETELF